jgi:hypothetical protein
LFDSLVAFGFTKKINFTAGGAGDTTVHTVAAGKKFVITYLYLESSASIDLLLKSGTTEMTGVMAITATTSLKFDCAGAPVFKATTTGDDFIINASGAGDVDGFAFMAEVDQ